MKCKWPLILHSFPTPNWDILANTNTVPLFRNYTAGRDAGQFLLMRNNEQELDIPLEYTGKIRGNGGHNQCESGVATELKKKIIPQAKIFYFKPIEEGEECILVEEDGTIDDKHDARYYCSDNQSSKDLHTAFKRQGLFFGHQYK